MKKILAFLFLIAVSSLFAQEYLYTIELSPENLADIDPRQNVILKKIGAKKNAIVVKKNDSSWLDLTLEECLGKEIIVTFRYKAAKKGALSKKASVCLRYAKGDVYCDGPCGKSVNLAVSDEWKEGSCTIKFPAQIEEAMIMFSNRGEDYLVTDIKVHVKK